MLIRITPGRSLCWSPAWPCSEAAVLFDANSGDYWVLSAHGQTAVRTLQASGALAQADLLARLPCDPAQALLLLQDLARSGIITAPAPAWPVGLESAVEALD